MSKPVIPMTDNPKLLEPSFAQAIIAIEQAGDLSDQHRRHWTCSLSQIAKWLDRPFTLIPARWTSVRIPVAQLHHARVGVTAKTLANHKSNVRAALRWFSKEHDVPVRGVPLSPEWAKLRDGIKDHGQRSKLCALMRYCSGRGVDPRFRTAIGLTDRRTQREREPAAFADRSSAQTRNATETSTIVGNDVG